MPLWPWLARTHADDAGSSAAAAPWAPQLPDLSPFRAVRLLGRGSVGEVYLCRHSADGRLYAVKTVALDAPSWRLELLKREVRAPPARPPAGRRAGYSEFGRVPGACGPRPERWAPRAERRQGVRGRRPPPASPAPAGAGRPAAASAACKPCTRGPTRSGAADRAVMLSLESWKYVQKHLSCCENIA
jgi:hypothetical protein